MTAVQQISTLEGLVPLVELRNVQAREVSGRRLDSPVDVGPDGSQEMGALFRESSDELEVRVRLTVMSREAELIADYAATFETSEPIKVDEAVKREFVERVGVMTVFPFLRESVFTTASRLQVSAPVIGLLRQGEVAVEPGTGAPEPVATSGD